MINLNVKEKAQMGFYKEDLQESHNRGFLQEVKKAQCVFSTN